MKPALMIHEFKEEYLSLPLKDYTLTFDDGLYSQFLYSKQLEQIDTLKIFFISSAIVCPEHVIQDPSFVCCRDAHEKAFSGDYSNYMKWSQIKQLNALNNCRVGCHGHAHIYNIIADPVSMVRDSRTMSGVFSNVLGYVPDDFCFPYNIESTLYKTLLLKHGIKNFYGEERIDIDDLCI